VTFNSSTKRWSTRRTITLIIVLLLLGVSFYYRALLAAAFATNPTPNDPASIARGAAIWSTTCLPCHGPQGRGDGPVTAQLAKKPKDLTRIAKPPVFPDGVLAYRIANGGVVMPAWGGVLSEREIWDLVNFIRAQRK
jgi:putative copper resistance protein D